MVTRVRRFSSAFSMLLPVSRPFMQSVQHVVWMTLLFCLMAVAPAQAQLLMRVAVEQDVSEVKVGSDQPAIVKDATGQILGEIPALGAIQIRADADGLQVGQWQAGSVWVEPTAGGFVYIGDRYYRGIVQVVPTAGGLTAVNHVDLEHYLYSVVASEMPTSWHLEALKAQSVAARTYALYQRQNGANPVFDVGDTQRWQVYKGIEQEHANTIAAVEATRGQVLTHSGQLIEAVFHSSSGGCTENVEDVWSSPRAYLRGIQDPHDQGDAWTRSFSVDQMSQLITGVGNILSLVPEETTTCGRIISMRVTGDQGSRVLDGDDFRRALELRSTLFQITSPPARVADVSNGAPRPTSFVLSGRGFGHGLGMSQYGAKGLAQLGYTYQQIVTYYYTGATLAQIRVE